MDCFASATAARSSRWPAVQPPLVPSAAFSAVSTASARDSAASSAPAPSAALTMTVRRSALSRAREISPRRSSGSARRRRRTGPAPCAGQRLLRQAVRRIQKMPDHAELGIADSRSPSRDSMARRQAAQPAQGGAEATSPTRRVFVRYSLHDSSIVLPLNEYSGDAPAVNSLRPLPRNPGGAGRPGATFPEIAAIVPNE